MIVPKHTDGGGSSHHISPDRFFSVDAEKTKLNWFLFEFALESEWFITKDKRLMRQLHQKDVTECRIADFCVHYAKHMKRQVLDRVAGRIVNVRLGYEEIEGFFPNIGDHLVDRLLTVAAKAWDSQTEACVVCPTRCISEKDERAPMFDNPYYSE